MHAHDLEVLSASEQAETPVDDKEPAVEESQDCTIETPCHVPVSQSDESASAEEPVEMRESMEDDLEVEEGDCENSETSAVGDDGNLVLAGLVVESALDGGCAPEQPPATPASEFQVMYDETAPLMSANLAGFDRPSEGYGEIIVEDVRHEALASRDGHTMQMPRLDSHEEDEGGDKSKDFKSTSSVAKKKSHKRAIVGIAVIAIVAAMFAFGTYEAQIWGGKVIPDVTNMTEADARSMLDGAGFKVKIREIKSDDTEGLVVLSDPSAGVRENEGAEVVIHIATSREIPDVVGKTKKEAKAALSAEGYENVKFKKEKSDESKGSVVSIAPKPGTACKSTAKVVVKIATPYTVPDIGGLDVDSAGQAIIDAGLSYDVEEVETEGYEDGAIIGTVPVSGTEVKKDSLVMIQIAKVRGPELESLTIEYLDPGSDVTIGSVSYVVDAVESVQYVGDDTVDFVITARPYTHLLGQKLLGSKRRVEGSIVWTDDNKISEIS